jgi:murein DD-endopeptidase MepM/ murein hydrolase activator NlpD
MAAASSARHRVPAILLVLLSACAIPHWPVEGPLVSPYGLRFRGVSPGLHRGVDIQVPEGTDVRAMAEGRVRFSGAMAGYGQVIWIDHPGDVLTVYAHLSATRVREGDEVEGRQVIGLSGRSGNATGAHLHFEVWRHGREVDPVAFLGGRPGGGVPSVPARRAGGGPDAGSNQSPAFRALISSASLGTTSKRSPTIP